MSAHSGNLSNASRFHVLIHVWRVRLPPNGERSHAGPVMSSMLRDALPALPAADLLAVVVILPTTSSTMSASVSLLSAIEPQKLCLPTPA